MVSSIAPGAGVAVVAPAGPVPEERYRAGLHILATRYRIVHAFEPTAARTTAPYLADNDLARADALNRAFRDPQIKAIFCARGGYGSSRLLPLLDEEAFRQRRPLLCGFSDITVLHAWAARLGVPTVHGPVVTQLGELQADEVEALFGLMEGGRPAPLVGLQALTSGCAQGPLAGGNLSLLAHLCGTPWQPRLEGRILLLEDVKEPPYRLDRMLTQLRLAGVLDGLRGALLGSFAECSGGPGPAPVLVVAERLADLGVPIAAGAPLGHDAHNRPVPLGVPALLDADRGRLEFLEG